MSDVRVGTRSRENTRARLLDAAFAVFAEVGLDAASVEAICERAELKAGGDVPSNPAAIVQQVVDVSVDSRQGVLLMSEIRIRAMRDPRTAQAYLVWQNGMTERVQGIIDDIVRVYGLRLRIPAEDFARIILSSWEATSADALIEGLDFEETCALVSARTQELAVGLVEGFAD